MYDRQDFLVVLKAVQEGRIDAGRLVDSGPDWLSSSDRPLSDYLKQSGWISEPDWSAIESSLRIRFRLPMPPGGYSEDDGRAGSTVDYQHGLERPPGSTRQPSTDGSSGSDGLGDFVKIVVNEGPSHGFGPRYHNVVEHAPGGQGIVYRAWDTLLKREVAIKALRPEIAKHYDHVKRFREEARVTASMAHPNIIAVYETGNEWAERPYYSMPLLGRRTFRDEILSHQEVAIEKRFEGRDFRKLIDDFLKVCDAIHYAHSDRKVLHRDIKARNVVIGPFGEVIMLDWGLAKRIGDPEDILAQGRPNPHEGLDASLAATVQGHPIGTLPCMPPEQAEGDHSRIGERSDVFGLGALLYHVLTGRVPYQGSTREQLTEEAIKAAPTDAGLVVKGVPKALEAIVRKAMAREPQDRYASAADLAEDVRRWTNDEPVSVLPENRKARTARWSRKHQPAVAGLFALLATALVASIVGIWFVRQEYLRAEEEKGKSERATIVATAGRKEADRATEVAQRVFSTTLTSFANFLGNVPQSERFRAQLTDTNLQFSKDLLVSRPEDPKNQLLTARIGLLAADINRLLFQHEASLAQYEEAIQMLDSLARRYPQVTDYRIQLGWTLVDRGIQYLDLGLYSAAAPDFGRALKLGLELVKHAPNARPAKHLMARALLHQGLVSRELGKLDEAERHFLEAKRYEQQILELRAGLPADILFSVQAQQILVGNALSKTLLMKGKLVDASKKQAETQELVREWIGDRTSPDNNRLAMKAASLYSLGLVQASTPEGLAQAIGSLDDSARIYEALSTEFLALPTYRDSLGSSILERGLARLTLASKCQDAEKAWLNGLGLADLNRASDIFAQLAAEFPASAYYPGAHARALSLLGRVTREQGGRAAGVIYLKEAIRQGERSKTIEDGVREVLESLKQAHAELSK